jgi:maltose alpha-D-glucosyltransferase/alpha-amylase
VPEQVAATVGPYLESARLLGQRTAELHLALTNADGNVDFVPEALSALYLRSLYQSLRSQTTQAFQLLQRRLEALPEGVREPATTLLARQREVEARFEAIRNGKIDAVRIRTHGDYHLGQVLYTGDDFVIIDFEGEPARPLGERRLKRSALRDVAGMIRSLHYAARAGMPPDSAGLDSWARYWHHWVSAAYLRGYLRAAGGAPFIPASETARGALLDVSLLEKAVYELVYELNNRPEWVDLPIAGILELLEE